MLTPEKKTLCVHVHEYVNMTRRGDHTSLEAADNGFRTAKAYLAETRTHARAADTVALKPIPEMLYKHLITLQPDEHYYC